VKKLIRLFWREPDFIVENDGKEYLYRWFLIPRNKLGFNIYLHRFLQSDEDRALHDHPWWSIGIILWGKYKEHVPEDYNDWHRHLNRNTKVKKRWPLIPVFRGVGNIHRIELYQDKKGNEKQVTTLFITGPRIRDWGFWCPKGWRHYKEFIDDSESGKHKTGLGCEGLD
jgi:hypothetical protein